MTPALPSGACDCHFHIMDAAAPTVANPLVPNSNAPVSAYRQFAVMTGLMRGVVVQPSLYGTDNEFTLRALLDLGSAYRAIVVIDPSAPLNMLKRWNSAGVRGVRFNQVQAGATTLEMLPKVARLAANLGWHIQLHIEADRLQDIGGLLETLPVPVVLDHFGRLPLPAGPSHPSWQTILRLLDKDKLWVKLSGPYHVSRDHSANYADAVQLAREFLKIAPERILWGSDWPHVTETVAPRACVLAAFIQESIGAQQKRVMVDNPASLYGFH